MPSTIRILASVIVVVLIATILQQANILGMLFQPDNRAESLSFPTTTFNREHSSQKITEQPLPPPKSKPPEGLPRIVRYKIAKQPHTGSKTLHKLFNSHPHIRDTFEPQNNTEAIIETMNCPEPCAASEIGRVSNPHGFRKPQAQKWNTFCQTAHTPSTVPALACGYSINIFTRADPTLNDLPQEEFTSASNSDNLLIIMSRLNVLEHALSTPMRRRVPGKKLFCDVREIQDRIHKSIASSRLVLNTLTRLPGRPVFVWWYEDFIQRPDELLRNLQDFLGVQVLELRNFNNTQEASRGKEKGGDLETNIENFAEIRELVQGIDSNLMPQFTGDWGRMVDTRQAFQAICSQARQQQSQPNDNGRVTYHRHLDTYCAADGTVFPISKLKG